MAEVDLKVYTRQLKELETAIYTQKELMKKHNAVIKEKRPIEPRKKQIQEPQKPNIENYSVKDSDGGYGVAAFCIFLGICGGGAIYFSLKTFIEFGIDFPFIALIIGVPFVLVGLFGLLMLYGSINASMELEKRRKNQMERYQQDVDMYPQVLEEYKKQVQDSEAKHLVDLENYRKTLDEYDTNGQNTMQKHNSMLASLEQSLEKLYSEDIVFPKYRNLVAITTINEYLESGRCYTLEGPDGAYNLYEMELRQNIVIGQLSNIITNLEQIRQNQFSLYEELKKSNEKVDDIIYELRQIGKDTKLNAYFSYVSALADTSPKIYRGFTY